MGRIWALSLGGEPNWFEIPTEGSGPTPSRASVIYDPEGDRLIVYDGRADAQVTTWALPLAGPARWAPLVTIDRSPPPRGGESVIYDPVRRSMVVFGASGPGC